MTKICSNCGKENKNTAKFCENCGQKLEEVINNTTSELSTEVNNNTNSNNNENTNKRPTQFCKYCGEKIDAEAEICPKCGVRLKNPISEKNPVVALLLSFIFPGIGQLYNEQNHKCAMLIIGAIISAILTIILIGGLLYFLIWVYGMYDAYKSAQAINNGELLEDKLFS